MSVKRLAALGALAGTAAVMGAGVASATPQPQPQDQKQEQPDAAPTEIKEAPLSKIAVDVPVGFADTGSKQFGHNSAPQEDAPVLQLGAPAAPQAPAPAPPAPQPRPEPTPPMPLPTPQPDGDGSGKGDEGKPGPEFPAPVAGAGQTALKGATGTVGSKAAAAPGVGKLLGGLPLGAVG